MPYVNLASATKLHRTQQIISDIGTHGSMQFYTGTPPAGPDFAATGTLLASLPLSVTAAGVASLAVQQASIVTPGTTGTNGTYNLTFTGGGGVNAAGFFIVFANTLNQIVITTPGYGYTSAPTIGGFTNAGLSGATATAVMTGAILLNPVASAMAVASGTVGWARFAKSNGTGVLDLDVGTTNASSVVMDITSIATGGMVACSAVVLLET